MEIYLLHFLKHLTTFVDLVYRCGLEKRNVHFDFFFNEMVIPCRVPTFRGQKLVKHGGHWDISFLFVDLTRSNLKFYGSLIVILELWGPQLT